MPIDIAVSLTFLLVPLLFADADGRLGKITADENQEINEMCDLQAFVDRSRSPRSPRILYRESKRVKRMLNGRQFDHKEMQYVVMLRIIFKDNAVPARCAGVIISPKHVLTAAHCFFDQKNEILNDYFERRVVKSDAKDIWIHYGGTCVNVEKDGKCPKSQLAQSVKALHVGIPSRYLASRYISGDIAIVEIEGRFSNLNTVYACLPSAKTKLHASLTSAGYGFDPHDIYAHEKYLERIWFRKDRFCDPTVRAGKDAFCIIEKFQFACVGDSGSGAMQPVNDYRDYVMGVLSRGLQCKEVDRAILEEKCAGARALIMMGFKIQLRSAALARSRVYGFQGMLTFIEDTENGSQISNVDLESTHRDASNDMRVIPNWPPQVGIVPLSETNDSFEWSLMKEFVRLPY